MEELAEIKFISCCKEELAEMKIISYCKYVYNDGRQWCERCDRFPDKPQRRFTKGIKKITEHNRSTYYKDSYDVIHDVRVVIDKEFLCYTCSSLKPLNAFSGSQLRKKEAKCLECQKTCPFVLKLSADKAKKKTAFDIKREGNKTVSEKLNEPEVEPEKGDPEKVKPDKDHYTLLPIEMLVAFVWFVMSSPPSAEGPHLLAYQADPTADPIWVPICGRYSDHQQTIEKATRLIRVPAGMCLTQIRLNKPVKKVDMSLQFLLLIIGSIAKLPLKVFTQRKFESGQDNSVNVHDEKCGCGKGVLSNKALPYCPSCICEQIREVTGTSEPPKYNAMTNSVVDWARESILNIYSHTEITDAIREVVTSSFWKDVVQFAMNYEIETQKMQQEKLSTMCSFCGGPCGLYYIPEATADTLTVKKLSPLPWKPVSAEKSISNRSESGETFYHTNAPFGPISPFYFDLYGAAKTQHNHSKKSQAYIEKTLASLKEIY